MQVTPRQLELTQWVWLGYRQIRNTRCVRFGLPPNKKHSLCTFWVTAKYETLAVYVFGLLPNTKHSLCTFWVTAKYEILAVYVLGYRQIRNTRCVHFGLPPNTKQSLCTFRRTQRVLRSWLRQNVHNECFLFLCN